MIYCECGSTLIKCVTVRSGKMGLMLIKCLECKKKQVLKGKRLFYFNVERMKFKC
jgi:hypothetical protein